MIGFDFEQFQLTRWNFGRIRHTPLDVIPFFNSWIAILQVDENGKINRLRRECPAEKCGAGVFMAAHKDRQYCGKCGKTFVFNAPE